MESVKTAKVQIHPREKDAQLLVESMKAYARGCSFVSEYIFETEDLSQASVQKHTYSVLRSRYGLPSQMACNAVRTVIGSYKTNKTSGRPWTLCRYNSPQMTLSWNRDYSLNSDRFSVGTLHGRIKCRYDSGGMEKYFDKERYSFGTAKVVCRHKKFFLHISVSTETDVLSDMDVINVVGIDRGVNFIASTYDSKGRSGFYSGKTVKNKRAHYKRLRRELQSKQTPSARRRLKAIGQRENRWMRDVNHCVSKALVESSPEGTLFVLEDLKGIRQATEKVLKKDRYEIVSWSFYDLEQKLNYKALGNRQKVIKVDPAYTSQTCPKCGHIDKRSRHKKVHTFVCTNCGYASNDDRIGAMNLYRMGIEYLVESQRSMSSPGGVMSATPDVTSA